MSDGGMPICSKHEFIESNLGDSDMGYEMSQAVSAAGKDGQNMEDALKARKDESEEMKEVIDDLDRDLHKAKEQIRRLRISQLRRMIQRAEWLVLGLFICDRRGKARLLWFIESCDSKIARLRGEG
jgi:hypothetical protein